MITTAELAWIAGLVEGEGCLHWHKKGYPLLCVRMTDRDVIERLAEYWDCPVTSRDEGGIRKRSYEARIYTGRAIGWIETLYVWLGMRRRQAARDLIRRWAGTRKTHCERGHVYSIAEYKRYGRCRACQQAYHRLRNQRRRHSADDRQVTLGPLQLGALR